MYLYLLLVVIGSSAFDEYDVYRVAHRRFETQKKHQSNGSGILVAVSAAQRPAMLICTLQYLIKGFDAEYQDYMFIVDKHYNKNILAIIRAFPFKQTTYYSNAHDFLESRGKGGLNAYPILEGLRFALMSAQSRGNTHILLIEEDVWISSDFFQFHSLVVQRLQNESNFIMVSAKKQRALARKCTDRRVCLTLSGKHYDSLLPSFSIHTLALILDNLELLKFEYFKNPGSYFKKRYNNPSYPFPDQDGIFRVHLEKHGFKVYAPECPRGFEAGYYGGLNRIGDHPRGNLEEQVDFLLKLNVTQMNAMHRGGYRDYEHVDLNPISIVDEISIVSK
jgi:hypothetical protein